MVVPVFNLLIVDDDKLIIEDIVSLINWESVFCLAPDSAKDGEEALKKMCEKEYDIVITDISMPKINGVDLIREAKKEGRKAEFIIISNFDDFIYVKEAMKLGALEYLLKYQINEDNLKEEILKAIKVIREKRNLKDNPAYRIEIQKAVDYMMVNYAQDIRLETLSELCKLSPSYLSKVFKEETGLNYIDFLRKVRIEEAKKMLRETMLRTNEIALSVGISDYRYFSRIFKEDTGMTCKEYRKAYVEKNIQ